MRKITETVSLTERFFGAIFGMLFSSGTAIALPWVLALKFPFKILKLFFIGVANGSLLLTIWIIFLLVCAFLFGFRNGFFKVLTIFNLIWKTGDSFDKELRRVAENCMTSIFLSCLVSYLLIIQTFD